MSPPSASMRIFQLRNTTRQAQTFVRGLSSWSPIVPPPAVTATDSGGPFYTNTGTASPPIVKYSTAPSVRTVNLPSEACAVICGAGIYGTSVAYHLAKQHNWKDVLVVEQGRIGCGTTWHAAGLLGSLRSTATATRLSRYTHELYQSLQTETGLATGYKKCGSIQLARTETRLTSLKRLQATARSQGVKAEFISIDEAMSIVSILTPADITGVLHFSDCATCNVTDVVSAMSRAAINNGVKIVEGVCVKDILTENGAVSGVVTDSGTVRCKYFINATGQWSRELGLKSNPVVNIPLQSCEHYYLVTKPFGLSRDMPVIRDMDNAVYLREWSGGLLAGGFEPECKPTFLNGIPDKFEFQLIQEDWEHFQVLLDPLLKYYPQLETVQIRQLVNGPECFTPDTRQILGEVPEINNYFVLTGGNSNGIITGGGFGKVLADWIVNGKPQQDLWSFDVQRFAPFYNNKTFLVNRVVEIPGHHYRIPWPMSEYTTSRGIRCSALKQRLESVGAVFGEVFGYERPNLFGRVKSAGSQFLETSQGQTFGKPGWFDIVKTEYKACRENVALMELSSYTKVFVESDGDQAVNLLQWLCSNNVDIPVGNIVHSGMLNEHGGFESDNSIVRLAHNKFFIVAPTVQGTRFLKWMTDHLPTDGTVRLTDVTNHYTVINVIGPQSESLLQELSEISLNKSNFKFMTAKNISVGPISDVMAFRMTHCLEPGWSLYILNHNAVCVYDHLVDVAHDYNFRHAGYYALRALRIEKGFMYWGQDLDTYTSPLECGREFRVKLHTKIDFLGRDATLRIADTGIKKRFCHFTVEGHDVDNAPWAWGREPLYLDDLCVGMTTTSVYGYTLGKIVCLGYVMNIDPNTGERLPVTTDWVLKNKFHIDIAGDRYPLKASLYAPQV